MRFEARHIVAMVACVSAAVVLAPVGVMAATGQLVNIADPVTGAHQARVTSRGTLWVESRAGVVPDSFNLITQGVEDAVGHTILEVAAPTRIAVTQATFTVRGDGISPANHMRLLAQVRTSGTAPCGGSGWSLPQTLVTLAVHAGDTKQLVWNGPPLTLPAAAAGQRICLRFHQTRWISGTETDVAVTGFTFK